MVEVVTYLAMLVNTPYIFSNVFNEHEYKCLEYNSVLYQMAQWQADSNANQGNVGEVDMAGNDFRQRCKKFNLDNVRIDEFRFKVNVPVQEQTFKEELRKCGFQNVYRRYTHYGYGYRPGGDGYYYFVIVLVDKHGLAAFAPLASPTFCRESIY